MSISHISDTCKAVLLLPLAIMFSCSDPVSEKSIDDLDVFEKEWKSIGLRLENQNPSANSSLIDGSRTVSGSQEKPSSTDSMALQESIRRYFLFRRAYDSVSMLIEQLKDSIAEKKIDETAVRKCISSFHNNLGDAEERLERWEEEKNYRK